MGGLEQAKPILVKMADWFGTDIIDVLSHISKPDPTWIAASC